MYWLPFPLTGWYLLGADAFSLLLWLFQGALRVIECVQWRAPLLVCTWFIKMRHTALFSAPPYLWFIPTSLLIASVWSIKSSRFQAFSCLQWLPSMIQSYKKIAISQTNIFISCVFLFCRYILPCKQAIPPKVSYLSWFGFFSFFCHTFCPILIYLRDMISLPILLQCTNRIQHCK